MLKFHKEIHGVQVNLTRVLVRWLNVAESATINHMQIRPGISRLCRYESLRKTLRKFITILEEECNG